jgi:glucose-1-phosphate adenylyltransferase
VRRSILASGVQVHSHATVDGAVLLDGVEVGRRAVVKRAIIDKNVRIPEGVSIGVDRVHDVARGFTISDDGVVVLGKDDVVPE